MASNYKPGQLTAAIFGNDSDVDEVESENEKCEFVPTVGKMIVDTDKAINMEKDKKHQVRVEHKQKMQKKLDDVKERDDECPRTLFVGNAPLTATRDRIRNVFQHFGKIESVRIRNVMPIKEKLGAKVAGKTNKFNENQKSLTFYVKYEKEESVGKVLEQVVHELDGNRLIVNGAAQTEYDSNSSVFCGNLFRGLTEDELIKHFSSCGEVRGVRIVRDKETHQGIGIAYVNFVDPDSVINALNMNGTKLKKRPMRVSKILKKKDRPAFNPKDKNKGYNKFQNKGKNGQNNKDGKEGNLGVSNHSKKIVKKIKKRHGDNKKTSMMA
uniref:RNA-binding protein 34 n=1 Tax=Rhabditophanes sp. KR3021 TaxID=114890 RepID=A0AC35TJX9_9BILA